MNRADLEGVMKQYTIRGVPREIEKMVEEEAGRTGLSANRAFISLLEKALLPRAAGQTIRKRHSDLDGLFGAWSEQEYGRFEEILKAQRSIDEDLWASE